MRIFQISLYISITLFVSGCMSIPGTGVSINDLVAHTEDTKKIYSQIRKESNHFSSFYDALSVTNNNYPILKGSILLRVKQSRNCPHYQLSQKISKKRMKLKVG